jgi:hypothetical protein
MMSWAHPVGTPLKKIFFVPPLQVRKKEVAPVPYPFEDNDEPDEDDMPPREPQSQPDPPVPESEHPIPPASEGLFLGVGGPIHPVFEDAWALLTYTRTSTNQGDRTELRDAFLRLSAKKPPLDREALIRAGKEVFGYNIATARDEVKKSAALHLGTGRTAPMVGTTEFLAEMVFRPGHEHALGYLVHHFDRPDDPPAFVPSVQTPETLFFPPSTGLLEAGVVLLPTTVEEYGDDWNLFIAIRGYLSTYLQIEDPEYRTLMVCYILMTWLYDRFNTVPYLRAQGEFASGKSRMLQVIGSVCYRAALAGGATTVSPIFRIIERLKGTLAIDEADFDRSDLWQEIMKILNVGYQRGFPVLRSERSDGDGEFDVKSYECYGPKLLATRRRFNDEALESRCLTYVTPIIEQLDPRIPLELDNSFRAAAQQLRNKLLLWRFRKWATTSIDPSTRLPGVEPRVNQILQPILSCISDLNLRATLYELVHKFSRRLASERREGLSGLVVQALLNRWVRGGRPGTLLLKTVVEELQIQHNLTKISNRKVSDVVRGNLGLHIEQRGGYAHVFLNPDHAERLAKHYSIDLTVTISPHAGGGIIEP